MCARGWLSSSMCYLIFINQSKEKVHIFPAFLLIWLDLGYSIVQNLKIKNQVKKQKSGQVFKIGLKLHISLDLKEAKAMMRKQSQ